MTDKDIEAAVPARPAPAAGAAREVVLVVFDGVEAIDVAGPASAFSKAADLAAGAYRVTIASPAGGEVATNAGLLLAGTQALHALDGPIDTLIVAGGEEHALRAAIFGQGVGAWLARVAPSARRVASVCTGAFALAAAGLLDGRQATTHWRACELLQHHFPQARVRRDCIYVRDGAVWTSAGVTTGLDLALALIEADLGRPVAVEIARNLALFVVRGSVQPQISAAVVAQADACGRIRELIAWVVGDPTRDLSVEALAERVCMSPRNFARAFAAQTGVTPARFVAQTRAQHAAGLLLQTDWPLDKIAACSGFGSVDALRRAFRGALGTLPDDYRVRRRPTVQGLPIG